MMARGKQTKEQSEGTGRDENHLIINGCRSVDEGIGFMHLTQPYTVRFPIVYRKFVVFMSSPARRVRSPRARAA